jgi:hypothetical protein
VYDPERLLDTAPPVPLAGAGGPPGE